MTYRLTDRVALITGAAGGIGRATALAFAEAGAALVLADLDEPGLEETAALCRARGARVEALRADVTSAADRERMIAAAEALGGLDVLVNNAGIFQAKPIDELTETDWDRMLEVNLKSVFFLSQAALRVMRPRGRGAIVNLASLAGQVGGIAAGANYAAAKGAVATLTKSFARHAGPHGIRVNCVNPGVIDTAMPAQFPPAVREEMVRRTPLGRMGQPEEVAAAVLFLASDAASFITGAHLDINGGLHMD